MSCQFPFNSHILMDHVVSTFNGIGIKTGNYQKLSLDLKLDDWINACVGTVVDLSLNHHWILADCVADGLS